MLEIIAVGVVRGVICRGTVIKFSKSRTRFYPGFSETNKIRVVTVNTLTPCNGEESNGCKIDRMLSSGGLTIRLTIGPKFLMQK